jgi:hypothetical protein
MFIVALFVAGFIVAMLLPMPKSHMPDIADLLAQIVRAVGKKL